MRRAMRGISEGSLLAARSLAQEKAAVVARSFASFCIQIVSRCTSNRLQPTKSYPTKGMAVLGRKGRDGGTFSSAPCANAGVPAGRFDMFRRLLPATLKAARMASGVRSHKPSEIRKAHKDGE